MLSRCDSCRENDITQPTSRENWKRCHARQTWGERETLIECYQKCCRYCLLYILQSGEKKFSLQMWEKEGKKQRFSSNEYLAGVLPES